MEFQVPHPVPSPRPAAKGGLPATRAATAPVIRAGMATPTRAGMATVTRPAPVRMPLRVLGPTAFLVALSLLSSAPTPLAAQAGASVPDSVDILGEARRNQERFERVRRRLANRTPGGYRGPCDETIGRICMRFGGGRDWWPEPETPEVLEARDSLLVRLGRAAERLPGDAWITGQRVAYLAEAGRLDAAGEVAAACRAPSPGWCPALRGYVAHRAGDHVGAEAAFEEAIEAMEAGETLQAIEAGEAIEAAETGEPDPWTRWTDPRVLLDGEGRDRLDDLGEEVRPLRIRRFWHWSDPLFLVPGNDRYTAHLARHVAVALQEEAEGAFNLSWGGDLEEVLLRYGWVYGWEIVEPAAVQMNREPGIMGQEHPESRRYTAPPGVWPEAPETPARTWHPATGRTPRSGHAPDYAPVLLPAPVEVARFPRGDTLVLVAWTEIPPDTSFHAGHDHPPLLEARAWQGLPDRHGLFALRDTTVAARATGEGEAGGLEVRLPPGRYLVSAEAWSPSRGRAGRMRTTLDWRPGPPDLPRVSDLLLVDTLGALPGTLEDAVPRMVPGRASAGARVGVVWELTGLDGAPGDLSLALEVEQTGAGVLTRVGRFLGLAGDPPSTGLEWRERAPESRAPALRSTWLALPLELEPGRYRMTLRVGIPGRSPLVTTREIEVTAPSR